MLCCWLLKWKFSRALPWRQLRPANPGAVCWPRGMLAFGDQKGHPPPQWVLTSSIPFGGTQGMLGVHWDRQHPPAEDQSWVQAGKGLSGQTPLQTQQLISRNLMRRGIFGRCRLASGLLGA